MNHTAPRRCRGAAFALALCSLLALDARATPTTRAPLLRSGLSSPLPGGFVKGYLADTGLDIAGFHLPVFAIAAGTVEYAEPGHTLWTDRGDDPNCVRVRLDAPITWQSRRITHVWYAHMKSLAFVQPEGARARRHVEAGELLGVSGIANRAPHLHLGLLLDGDVSQRWGSFLDADQIRALLGDYRNGEHLPGLPTVPAS